LAASVHSKNLHIHENFNFIFPHEFILVEGIDLSHHVLDKIARLLAIVFYPKIQVFMVVMVTGILSCKF